MNGRNAKLARKAANDAATQTGREAANVSLQVLEYARKIELQVTKGIEPAVSALEIKARAWDAFRHRDFLGRLRWLLAGR